MSGRYMPGRKKRPAGKRAERRFAWPVSAPGRPPSGGPGTDAAPPPVPYAGFGPGAAEGGDAPSPLLQFMREKREEAGGWNSEMGGYDGTEPPAEEARAPEKKRPRRPAYMGPTPSKASRVGKRVVARMLENGSDDDDTILMEDLSAPGEVLFMTEHDQERIYLMGDPDDDRLLHMGHIYDAVTFWNEVGRFTGAKSKCVRAFMNDPNNYRIQFGPRNCQRAPRVPYLPPVRNPLTDFEYIPFPAPGNFSNVEEMIRRLRELGYPEDGE